MAAQREPSERIRQLTNEELSELLERCRELIGEGKASSEDFETYVLGQAELTRRTWG